MGENSIVSHTVSICVCVTEFIRMQPSHWKRYQRSARCRSSHMWESFCIFLCLVLVTCELDSCAVLFCALTIYITYHFSTMNWCLHPPRLAQVDIFQVYLFWTLAWNYTVAPISRWAFLFNCLSKKHIRVCFLIVWLQNRFGDRKTHICVPVLCGQGIYRTEFSIWNIIIINLTSKT